MRRYLTIVTLILLVSAVPSFGAIARVQDDEGSAGFSTSCALVVSALTTGNIVFVGGLTTNEAVTLTPSATNVSFTSVSGPTNHSGATNLRIQLWYGTVDTGGATAVTVTGSSDSTMGCWVGEFSGLATSSVLDQTATPAQGTGTALDVTAAVTTTTADEVLIGQCASNGPGFTFTAGASYTLMVANTARLSGQYRIVAATGSYSAPMTIDASSDWVCQMGTFKIAGGGAVTRSPVLGGGVFD